MIIFGTRGVSSTAEQGDFNCPQCDCKQAYKYKKVRRFFTLYFIPVIPLDRVGEYVECQRCKGTFIPKVLNYQAEDEAFLAEYEKALKHTMVLIMLADGHVDPDEMLMVQSIVNKFSHHDISLQELEVYVKKTESQPQNLGPYLKSVAPSLNEHGKEVIIKCAISVAAADGVIDDSEIAMVQEIGQQLDMSQAHLKGIVREMLQPTDASPGAY